MYDGQARVVELAEAGEVNGEEGVWKATRASGSTQKDLFFDRVDRTPRLKSLDRVPTYAELFGQVHMTEARIAASRA